MAPPQVSEYELQRAQRIEENRRKMAEIGLVDASRDFAAAAAGPAVTLEAGNEWQPRKKRRTAQPTPAQLEPTRLSRRLRGEEALAADAAQAAAMAELEAEGGARGRRGANKKRLALEDGVQLVAPFSLWSIGVTVWELGQVHRGAWAHRYWSSSGCLYHHAYPVGYRATKVQFGRTYEMRIEEGPTGPLFKVIDQQTGTVFCGESPTKPWTDVCIAHRTGQRISGPLFFGFSDPITQRAIAANLYTEEELRAALQGNKVESGLAATPEEQAARELCEVEGIGEATAIVLARSTALGGGRHPGLASLKAWASASDANAQALFDYLTGSSEVPEATRRWPAWRQRLAPRIALALSGRWLGSGPPPAAAGGGGKQENSGQGAAAAEGGQNQCRVVRAAPAAGREQTADGQGQLDSSSDEVAGAAPQRAAALAGDQSQSPSEPVAGAPARADSRGPSQTAAAVAGSKQPSAKENKRPQNKSQRTATSSGVASAALLQRSGRRERKASQKWAEYVTDNL